MLQYDIIFSHLINQFFADLRMHRPFLLDRARRGSPHQLLPRGHAAARPPQMPLPGAQLPLRPEAGHSLLALQDANRSHRSESAQL